MAYGQTGAGKTYTLSDKLCIGGTSVEGEGYHLSSDLVLVSSTAVGSFYVPLLLTKSLSPLHESCTSNLLLAEQRN